ncbi:putative 2-carboxy-D-arabinitol-1-phosphatase [Glycine soja]|uniref:Putative 2-carboxy-D-arabinitol-1-phosphatase isoform B n=1 Tax=Glycine soja TaxID=3848 RepID=A0A445I978_GLYSO|nr:putative 2-carboxy-D-arabinitol-1-phosphatase [Glycine max]RZB82579.1 putative 2-carboxy-D-arabinitol-1-phosphatase isoform B [Glycine soja]
MGTCGIVLLTKPSPKPWPLRTSSRRTLPRIRCCSASSTSELSPDKLPTSIDLSVTGGAYDFSKATTSLTNELISSPKKVTLLRHGLSTWNSESRIQGSSDLSVLTEVGEEQAKRCKKALENIYFDQCFASPISRAKQTAEIIWQWRENPLVYLDSLKEISLYHLEGMKNVDAMQIYPKEYTIWREDPANFLMNGRYPVRDLWKAAKDCWKEMLLSPVRFLCSCYFVSQLMFSSNKIYLIIQGESFLVVTHKSILRALTCTALGLGPERFRSIDINNGGICVFNFNVRGEAMLEALNMTAHMYSDHVYPG